MEAFKLAAQPRTEIGSQACRRLRRQGLVPAILYGHQEKPLSLQVDALELERHMRQEAFYSQVLNLDLEGEVRRVVLKDLQRHPYQPRILHLDLQRVAEDEALTLRVPLHFSDAEKCVGVKQDSGVLTYVMTELEVVCLPKDLPEYIEVDVSELGLHHTLHLGDIQAPKGVRIHALLHGGDPRQPVVSVQPRRTEVEEEDEAPSKEEEAGEAAAEDEQEK